MNIITQQTTTEQTATEQVKKPTKSANAARRNKYTGSVVSLSNAEGVWQPYCVSHSFPGPQVKTRTDAENLRVAGTFCPTCQSVLTAKNTPTDAAQSVPLTAKQQPTPTPKSAPKTAAKTTQKASKAA